MKRTHRLRGTLTALVLTGCLVASGAHALAPDQILAAYAQQAGAAPQADRGRDFFTSGHGREWSCASCHGATPVRTGQHAATGKLIGPMAPAVNPARFSDGAKVEKWFRRNCNDVLGRECSALEKADVLSWLLALKR